MLDDSYTSNKRMKVLRKEADMTQAELGVILGVGRTTVNSYEVCRIHLTQAKINRLSEYFNVSTDYIMGKTDIREPISDSDKDVKLQLDLLINDLINSTDNLTFNGDKMDETTKSILVQSLKNSVDLAKSMTSNSKKK